MELEDFQGSRMHKWLKPRFRQGQVFYSGIANLAWQSRNRPYLTPILFLVIKHYGLFAIFCGYGTSYLNLALRQCINLSSQKNCPYAAS